MLSRSVSPSQPNSTNVNSNPISFVYSILLQGHRHRTLKRNVETITSAHVIPFDKWSIVLEIFAVRLFFRLVFLSDMHFVASSTSAISALLNDEQTLENEDDGKDLDLISTDDARMDMKTQVKNFANSFQKKCANQKMSLDILAEDYANFKEIIAQRMQTNSIYRGK